MNGNDRASRLVVIGASWGGLDAMSLLLDGLPGGLEIALAYAQHRSAHSRRGSLEELLREHTPYAVEEAWDKQPIEPGHLYVAPANYHLLVEPGALALSVDERVNFARPSLDVLFESAADAYADRAIGVILTGASADGAAGLAHVKRRGGVAVVQSPETAERPTMPRAAIAATVPDAILPPGEIGRFVSSLCEQRPEKAARA